MDNIDFTATNSDGETIDLRDLTSDELRAYRTDAGQHGDLDAVAAIDHILSNRGEA